MSLTDAPPAEGLTDAELAQVIAARLEGKVFDSVTHCLICGGLTVHQYVCENNTYFPDINDRNCFASRNWANKSAPTRFRV